MAFRLRPDVLNDLGLVDALEWYTSDFERRTEIASAYHINIKTVDTYRARLLKKLGLRNNADISRFAMQNQLIEP